MTNANNVTAQLDNYRRFREFGFLVNHEGQKILLHRNTLLASGFTVEQVQETSLFVVEISQARQGLKVDRVVSIDGKLPVSPVLKQPSPKIVIGMFINAKRFDVNHARDEHLWKIYSRTNTLVQFVVTDKEGTVLRQLGQISEAQAKAAIQKKIPRKKWITPKNTAFV